MIKLLATTALSVMSYAISMANEINIKNVTLSSSKVDRDAVVVFISDIHRRRLTRRLRAKLPTHADALLIGGDLTEAGVPLSRTDANLALLKEIGDLYYVFGNNDREVGEADLVELLEKHQVKILRNNSVILSDQPIQILGLDDGYTGKVNLEQTIQNFQSELYSIALSHSPHFLKKISRLVPIDLGLAGHYHGGQIRFSKWGLQPLGYMKTTDSYTEIISNGFGTTAIPLRVGAESEVHVIRITRKK